MAGIVSEKPIVKYGSISLDTGKTMHLEGWSAEGYLSIRTKIYFKVLINCINNRYRQEFPTDYENYQLKKLVTQELLIGLEVIRARKDANIVNQIMKDNSVSDKQQNAIKQAHLDNLKNKILSLKQNEQYVYHSGTSTHSLYITFSNKDGKIFSRIDNLGSGCENHIKKNDGDRIKPCLIDIFDSKSNTDEERLVAYLENIFDAKFKDHSLHKIYKNKCIRDPLSDTWPYFKLQNVGNCVVSNYKIGMQIRCINFYDWLHKHELREIHNLRFDVPEEEAKMMFENILPTLYPTHIIL